MTSATRSDGCSCAPTDVARLIRYEKNDIDLASRFKLFTSLEIKSMKSGKKIVDVNRRS